MIPRDSKPTCKIKDTFIVRISCMLLYLHVGIRKLEFAPLLPATLKLEAASMS